MDGPYVMGNMGHMDGSHMTKGKGPLYNTCFKTKTFLNFNEDGLQINISNLSNTNLLG